MKNPKPCGFCYFTVNAAIARMRAKKLRKFADELDLVAVDNDALAAALLDNNHGAVS